MNKILDVEDYDCYRDGDFWCILPSITTLGTLDFFDYYKHYIDIGNMLCHLPVYVDRFTNDKEAFKLTNEIVTLVIGKEIFSIEEINDKGKSKLKVDLGLYILYELAYRCYDGKTFKILDKLLTGFSVTIFPNSDTGKAIANKILYDCRKFEYQKYLSILTEGCNLLHHLLFYKAIRESNGNTQINNQILFKSHPEDNKEEQIYSFSMHEKFSRDMCKKFNVDYKLVGDCFDISSTENPCLLLGYILFNYIILGNSPIMCMGKILWYGEGIRRKTGECFLVNKDMIGDFIRNNNYTECISLINEVVPNAYISKINDLEMVKALKDSLGKSLGGNVSKPKEKTIEKDFTFTNEERQKELLKEINLIISTTDSADMTVVIKQKKVQHLKSEFQVNDISRLGEIREFTSQNGGAHIEHYDYGKRYIKGDRIKNIGGKKGKYDGK